VLAAAMTTVKRLRRFLFIQNKFEALNKILAASLGRDKRRRGSQVA